MRALRPVVRNTLVNICECVRATAGRGELSDLFKGDYVLVIGDDFHEGEKL